MTALDSKREYCVQKSSLQRNAEDAVQTLKKDSLLTAVKGLLWIHPVNGKNYLFVLIQHGLNRYRKKKGLAAVPRCCQEKVFNAELPEESLRYVEQDITEFLRIVEPPTMCG